MSVEHDFSAVEALEREFAEKRQETHKTEVEKELSPLRAKEKEANGRAEAQIIQAQAERRRKTGWALLATGVGVGAAAFGLSYLIPPKIIETTKVVTDIKTVEVPKIVEVPKVVETTKVVEVPKVVEHTKVVEVPKIIERTVPAPPPPPAPAPRLGERSSVENFTGSEDYRNTVYRGKIVSHQNGEIKFDNGKSFTDVFPDGSQNFSITNRRHDGDFGYCAQSNDRLPDGRPAFYCFALHNGVVERTGFGSEPVPVVTPPPVPSPTPVRAPSPRRRQRRQAAPQDPFDDLFDFGN